MMTYYVKTICITLLFALINLVASGNDLSENVAEIFTCTRGTIIGGKAEVSSGIKDDWRIRTEIEEMVAEAILSMRSVIPLHKPSDLSCRDLPEKVVYKDSCFWAILPKNEVKYIAADQLCAQKGAKPANIYTERHYKRVMKYLHGVREDFYHVYLGMAFDPQSGNLTRNDGMAADYARWRSGDPVTNVADPVKMTRVAIDVLPDADDVGNGMLTSAIIWPKTGVLCELAKM